MSAPEFPIVVVTGGSRGIGAATAELAASQGYSVCINYRRDADAARAVVERIEGGGGTAVAVAGDVSDTNAVERLFEAVDAMLGQLHGLVNNAGLVAPQGRVEETNAERLQALFATNVIGAFLCAQQAIRRMSTRHGGAGGPSSTSPRPPRDSERRRSTSTTPRPRGRPTRSRSGWRSRSPQRACA